MAVPNVPFYLSQANQEFLGTPVGSASVTMGAAGVSVPGKVSALGGMSNVITVNLPGGLLRDVNVLSYITAPTAGKRYNINIPSDASYRSSVVSGPALSCVIADAASVTLNVASGATIWGKGGKGGDGVADVAAKHGQAGGPGLYRSANTTVSNAGSILGGGGGGGAGSGGTVSWPGGSQSGSGGGGGGGCSEGAGGICENYGDPGGAGSTTAPGGGGYGNDFGSGGSGGAAGQPGAPGGSYNGAPAGQGGASGPSEVVV